MMRFTKTIAAAIFLSLAWVGAAVADSDTYCFVDAGPPVHWAPCSSANPLQVTGSVTVTTPTNPVGITPTDRTITSASGSSQQMAAANATRHSLTIVNTGNANCGINPTGGTASIGGAGTLTLTPFGAYTPRIPSLSAITVICTSGQPIYGDEN
jgi:hypothetical protein